MQTAKTTQCVARTHKGHQCKQKTSALLCTTHQALPKLKVMLMDDPEPWTIMGLWREFLVYCTSVKAKTKLRHLCWADPSRIDRNGFLYVYRSEQDGKLPYYKIGTTERSPVYRLKEWGDTMLVFGVGVKHHKVAEQLVFTLLESIRLKRHWNKEDQQYTTCWFDTGEPVEAGDRARVRQGKTEKKECERHVEWFRVVDKEFLFEVVDHVADLVNAWPERKEKLRLYIDARTISDPDRPTAADSPPAPEPASSRK